MSIPEMSRCAVLEKYGEPLELKEIRIPEVEPGAILIKILLATICGTDINLWQGRGVNKARLPKILGHEMVGEIVKMGVGVTKDSFGNALSLGDRIIFSPPVCHQCYFCNVLGRPNLCPNRVSIATAPCDKPPYLIGGFSEYIYVLPKSGLMKVPLEVDNEEAAPATCAFRTVMRSFELLGQIGTEDIILIQGAGNLGLCATALADNSKARSVIIVDINDERLEQAKRFGADITINISDLTSEQLKKKVLDLTEGRGPDIVMEYVSIASAFKQGLELIRRGGRYILAGSVEGNIDFTPSVLTTKEVNIQGVFSADIEHYYKSIAFIKNNKAKYPFSDLVTKKYELQDINKAFNDMTEGRERKPGILFE